ncbi:MAG: hypothetical protein Kow00108_13820 [Calditrichia bacterium]
MSVKYKTPGVYVREISRGNKPIESVGTSTAVFIGFNNFVYKKNDKVIDLTHKPQLVSNWSQFTEKFGDFRHGSYLASAVYGYFANGGTNCYIISLGKEPVQQKLDSDEKEKNENKSKAVKSEVQGVKSLYKLIIGEDAGPGKRTGLHAIKEIEEYNLVCVPGITDKAIQDAIIQFCERNRTFAILDGPKEIPDNKGIDFILQQKPAESSFAAMYFPWVYIYNPFDEQKMLVPPSGLVAGMIARVDSEKGVHKAPANEKLKGALGVKYKLTDVEQGVLNPKGINVIRDFSDTGVTVWGARTLSADAEWRYISTRRLFLMIEKTLEKGTRWVVFEPNTPELWMRIIRNVKTFLLSLWRDGALFGKTPEEAFYIKCDEENNTPETIDQGMVNIEIGLAAVKPAEFVVFELTQWSGPEEGETSEGGEEGAASEE